MLKALLRLFINLIKMFYFINLVRGDSIAVVGIYRKNGTRQRSNLRLNLIKSVTPDLGSVQFYPKLLKVRIHGKVSNKNRHMVHAKRKSRGIRKTTLTHAHYE